VTGPTSLVIVGAGGHGRETLDVVEAVNDHAPATWRFEGFLANDADTDLLVARGAELIGSSADLAAILAARSWSFHLGIGSGDARAQLDRAVPAEHRDAAAVLIHPAATVGSLVRLAPGVFLAAGARVTTNVTLGRHTHLNVNAVVSHDCVIGECVTLSPGVHVNGSVEIGDRAFLGAGAVVLPGRRVGVGTTIGAGAVVVDDVPDGVTAKGVPARW